MGFAYLGLYFWKMRCKTPRFDNRGLYFVGGVGII